MRRSWFFIPALAVALATPCAVRAQTPDEPPAEPPAEAPLEDDLAETHAAEGRAAADKGDWQRAYTSYRAAYAIKETYLIAGALGGAAHRVGKYRDAAEYLTVFLQKAPPTLPAEARATAEKALADARTRVGTLTIVAPAGAEVFVNHVIAGKGPLGRDVFVEPGKCDVEARSAGGEAAKQSATVEKGKSASVTLVFGADQGPQATVTAAPSQTGTGAPTTSATSPAAPPDGPRSAVWITGVSVAAGAAVAGAILLGVSRSRVSEEDKLRAELVTLGKGNVCVAAARDPRCDQVRDAGNAADALTNAGAWLLIGAGAAGAATAIYALVTRSPAAPRVEAAAIVAPQGGGASVSVRW